jgi:RNA polymerase sigma factor (sigma-70 family)
MVLPRRDLRCFSDQFDFVTFEKIRTASDGGKRFAEVLLPLVRIFVRGELRRQRVSRTLAEDATQDVIFHVWQHRLTVSFPDAKRLFAWLWRVSHNAVVNTNRHRRRSRATEAAWDGTLRVAAVAENNGRGHAPDGDQVLVVDDDPTRAAIARERGEVTARAIHELPPRQRSILVRWMFRGEHPSKIARDLAVSPRVAARDLNAAFRAVERALRRFVCETDK